MLAAGLLAAFGCVRPALYHTSLPTQVAVGHSVSGRPEALVLEAELGDMPCSATRRSQLRGFARIEVRDGTDDSAKTEVEYEIGLENRARLRLGESVIRIAGTQGGDRVAAVLWTGEMLAKPRFRVRGIVALRPGVTVASISSALRDRRGALQLRISDARGAPLACADLRE